VATAAEVPRTSVCLQAGSVTSRHRDLPGSFNVRDLGGLPTVDGARLRPGLMFRSDYPAFADQDEGRAVKELGIRTVVDLRGGAEAAHELVVWEALGVSYQRSPIIADIASSWHASYPSYLTRRPETVLDAVRRVLDPESQPVLFHCAAGKDRTGVVAALVLSVLGVADDDIVADYVLSEPSVRHVLARLADAAPYRERLMATTVAEQLPRAEVMREFLASVDELGGAEQWLLDHGFAPAEVSAARRVCLEPPRE
jgi:protein-tyrosine phosphatase